MQILNFHPVLGQVNSLRRTGGTSSRAPQTFEEQYWMLPGAIFTDLQSHPLCPGFLLRQCHAKKCYIISSETYYFLKQHFNNTCNGAAVLDSLQIYNMQCHHQCVAAHSFVGNNTPFRTCQQWLECLPHHSKRYELTRLEYCTISELVFRQQQSWNYECDCQVHVWYKQSRKISNANGSRRYN